MDPSELTRTKRRSTSGTLQDEKESEPLSKRRRQHSGTTEETLNGDSTKQEENNTSNHLPSSENAPKTTEKTELKITVLPPTPNLPSEEIILCKICGKGDRDEELLLCDGCDAGYHTFCMNPPLSNIPSGDWFCETCIAQGKHITKKKTAPAVVPEAVPLEVCIFLYEVNFLHRKKVF